MKDIDKAKELHDIAVSLLKLHHRHEDNIEVVMGHLFIHIAGIAEFKHKDEAALLKIVVPRAVGLIEEALGYLKLAAQCDLDDENTKH